MARGLEASDTARRSVEAERDRFFTLSLDLLCVAGFDGYFKRLNPAWEKALGFTTQELLQTPYMELVHPADREATAAEALGLSGGGVTLSFENRYVTKSGAHRWLLWSAVAVPGQEQIYAVARDITERKLAEETLQRLAIIVESSDDAIIHNDLEGNVLSWNRGAVQLFGFTAEEVLGRPAPITPPDRVHERQMFRQRLLEGGKLEQYETQQLHKDGRLRDISLTISAVRNQRAEIVGAATIARDITETKRNQNAIRDLNHQLEQRLAELSASNQELEAFSYSVSHDLRAPLRQVHGFAKVVEEQYGRQLDSQGQHYLGRIEEGAAKMGRLIDDLLNLSRLGRRPLQRQPTELAALVEGVCTDLQAEINGRKVEWRIQPLPSADCDPGLIKQVFANLLENSLKYTRPRERALIEVGQRAENGEQMIYVRDNGVGFNMKYADKLFGVFQRLHRSDEFEGTGVGLATVQRIVQKHGGRIWAEGEEGQGATFCFTLGAAGAAASVDLQVEEIRT
jgi:PAS domain S-box-containing protein